MAETETKPVTMVPTHEQETGNLLACLKSYYRSSKFTDITIITPEKELRVHKLVLCSQSGYFARMFNGDWLETNTNTIKLEGDDHRFLVTMIDFMYGYDYDTTDHGNTSPIMFHIAAYQIADKYDVPKMKKRAKEKFEGIVAVGWDMDDFAAAVAEVYRTTPMCERGLRDPLVRVTNRRFGDLLQKESFVKMLEQTPGFAADLARTNYVGGCCNCKAGINADGWCF